MEKLGIYSTDQLASTLRTIRYQNESGATQILGEEIEAELERRRLEVESQKFITDLKERIAEVSVSPSALRNQGAGGVIGVCREYLKTIDLINFANQVNSSEYQNYLNAETYNLLDLLPEGGKSWGAARKSLNLFFRDVCYNYYLRELLALEPDGPESSLSRLEIPLDKDVAIGLKKAYPEIREWQSIKSLTPLENEMYQNKAKEYADSLGTLRVHLDLIFWRKS